MDFPNPKELVQTVGKAAGTALSEGAELADKALPGDSRWVSNAVKPVVNLLDSKEPDGTDGGSSNWAAWGHPEIRQMLDSSVTPEDIHGGAQAWGVKGTQAADIVTGLTSDLNGIVTGGWRGDSAEAAVGSLSPIIDWSSRLSEAVERTNRLMDASGDAAGQAKDAVPPPLSHSWGGTLRSFSGGGPVGAFRDAVAQDDAQAEARAQAVQIMNSVYSAPINDNRAAVPVYPTLTDPTFRPPEPSPDPRPVPQPGSDPGGRGGGGGVSGGGSGGSTGGGGSTPYQAGGGAEAGGAGAGGVPAATGGQAAPFQPGAGGGHPVGGQGGGTGGPAGGGGVPIMPPAAMGGGAVGGAGAAGGRAGSAGGGRFGGAAGGRIGGAGGRFGAGGVAGGQAGFGPRGSGGVAGGGVAGGGAGQGAVGRGGPGGGAAGGRGGMAGGMMGAGAGRGRGGEDTEHQRASYLIEMNDVFNDGRKVAPPVIGEDPPESGR